MRSRTDANNRANQLNPNNPAYWGSRGVNPPASPPSPAPKGPAGDGASPAPAAPAPTPTVKSK